MSNKMDMKSRIDLELRGKDPHTIKELNLDLCRAQQIDGLDDQFSSLEILSLNNVGLTTLKGWPKLPNLKKIELSDNRINGGLEYLASCTNLIHINLSGNKIKDFETLAPLAQLPNLTNLDLYNCEITKDKEYRKTCFEMLPSLKFLDDFDLTEENEYEGGDDDDEDDEDDDDDEGEENGAVNGRHYKGGEGDEDDDEDEDDEDFDEDEEDEDDDEEGDDVVHAKPHGPNGRTNGGVKIPPNGHLDDEDDEDDDEDDEDFDEDEDVEENIQTGGKNSSEQFDAAAGTGAGGFEGDEDEIDDDEDDEEEGDETAEIGLSYLAKEDLDDEEEDDDDFDEQEAMRKAAAANTTADDDIEEDEEEEDAGEILAELDGVRVVEPPLVLDEDSSSRDIRAFARKRKHEDSNSATNDENSKTQ